MWNLERWLSWSYLQSRHWDIEGEKMDFKGERVVNWEIGIDIYMLLFVQYITDGNLLHKPIEFYLVFYSDSDLNDPSEGRQNGNHNYRKRTKLMTWITVLSNSIKLWAMLCRATENWWVMVESSDKTWSTWEGNGKPVFLPWDPMNNTKKQKDMKLKDELPRPVGTQMLLEKSGEIAPERMKRWAKVKTKPSCACEGVMEVMSDAVKNNIA